METTPLSIELNNQAVSLIENGLMENAISLLTKSLSLSKKFYDYSEDVDNQNKNVSSNIDQCMMQNYRHRICDDDMNQDNINKELFVYEKAIPLPTSFTLNKTSAIMVSVVVIFNLALCHHQISSQNRSDSRVMLKQAAKLYKLAYELQMEESLGPKVLFTMALVNNIGVLKQTLGETDIAGRCFQRLLSTLMYLKSCNATEMVDFAGFFRNTSYLILRQHTAAAA